MRLLGIAIDEFRMIRDQWLPAHGLVVLFGPNSAGKTSVLEAAVEILMAASRSRIDPGVLRDVFAIGSVRFTLPDAEISGSPDAELYGALLKGDYAGSRDWEELEYEAAVLLRDKPIDDAPEWLASRLGDAGPAGQHPDREILARAVLYPAAAFFWERLVSEAAELLREKRIDDAREWIASRLADAGPVGQHPDREILARAVLYPAAAFFVAFAGSVFMCVDAAGLPDDAVGAARRIAAADADRNDFLVEIAVNLTTQQAAVIGWVADREKLADAFPQVIVLDGAPESLAAELRTALPVIHDRLWGLYYSGGPGGGHPVDEFEIGTPWGSADRYKVDTWLEQMSDTGEPEIRGPFGAYGRGADWYRVRHSILAVAAVIEQEANRVAPSFIQDQGLIGVEVLPMSVWGLEDHRVRVTFTGRDGERRDVRVVGAGTARWAAAAVQLACRRLEKGRRVVTDQAGIVVGDLEATRELVQAARTEPLSQSTVRLEPLNAPGVYVVDEPEAHLHPLAIASIRAWLEGLARAAGTTVLAATHSPILLNTSSGHATRVLVLPRDGGTELHPVASTMDDRLAAAANELGITRGDLLLMTRLGVFVEGPHDVIILSEWFGDELRGSGIRVFPAHGADNFGEITTTKPGLVGSEIIGALGIRMAVISDKRPTRGERTTNRVVREGNQQGYSITAFDLSEEDILFYLDEQVCREFAPHFPGWQDARNAAHRAERRNRDARKWKKWISESYGLDLSRDGVRQIAAECRRENHIAPELRDMVQQLTALAATYPADTGPHSH
jgi:AAA domain, putative AbiEii toxin, Type IV TA system